MNPDSSTRPEAATDLIRRQAAEWLALREARPWQAPEQAAFAVWCAADPRHAEIFAEMESAYRTFDQLAFYPRPADGAIDPDLLVRTRHRAFSRTLVTWAAAAAAIAVVAGFWWQGSQPVERRLPAVAASPRFLHLPDGSRVELNSGSEVAEHFTAAERRIRLVRGEAHFEVAKNPSRPFIVEADNVAVRAVGTAFDVRLGATAVDVLVTEGTVKVTAETTPDANGRPAVPPALILTANQRTVVPTVPGSSEPLALAAEILTPHQIDRALAWQASRVAFEDMPLAQVAEKFNAMSAALPGGPTVRLRVEGRELSAMRISGRVRVDSVENFVQVLQDDFGVKVERNGSEICLRRG